MQIPLFGDFWALYPLMTRQVVTSSWFQNLNHDELQEFEESVCYLLELIENRIIESRGA